ncbi:kinase-like domain-containing protein [Aspergillus crustosus]
MRHFVFCTLQGQLHRASSPTFLSTSSLFSLLRPLHRRTNSTASAMVTGIGTKIEPHAYTSGRWLRRNELEIESRYIQFNFDALCQKVIELSPGASAISDCRKIEGGFNRVFIFTLDNGKKIVARLPFQLAGPARLTTILKLLRSDTTSIPIPEILDWNHDYSDINNTVGSEYIIMKHANGVPLHKKWQEMAGDQQVRCISAIYKTLNELVDLEFPAFGSLYFNDTFDSTTKQSVGDGFCVGFHCGLSIGEYCDGLIDSGLSRVPAADINPEKRAIYHGSPETHSALLKCARSVLKRMSTNTRICDSAAPLLFHPDLHMRNIFVSEDDPSVITSIIDWQGASIEPAFWYSDEVPDFATGSELCTRAFDLSSQFYTPKLSGPRLMDDTLYRPFLYSYRTWKDGAVALHHEIIETARLWKEIRFKGQCPYPLPTREELVSHEKEYKLFETAQQLRTDLSGLLDTASDGWVPPDRWKETHAAHKQIFDEMLQAVLSNPNADDDDEPVKDEMTLRAIWPFDID